MPDCIEYCVANPSPSARRHLRAAGAVEHPCLGRCGRCRREPFLVVDGTPVAGDHDALAAELIDDADAPAGGIADE